MPESRSVANRGLRSNGEAPSVSLRPTLLLLAAHHVWSVAGNVDLKRADGTTRTFDLSMQDLGHSMAAEVKAPLKLRRGGKPPLKVLAAKDVVLDAIRKAGTREG